METPISGYRESGLSRFNETTASKSTISRFCVSGVVARRSIHEGFMNDLICQFGRLAIAISTYLGDDTACQRRFEQCVTDSELTAPFGRYAG